MANNASFRLILQENARTAKLVPTVSELDLTTGITTIGRKTIDLADARVSRKQFQTRVLEGAVEIRCGALNPTRIIGIGSKHAVALKKNEWRVLVPGEVVCLIEELYQYRLEKQGSLPPDAPAVGASQPPPPPAQSGGAAAATLSAPAPSPPTETKEEECIVPDPVAEPVEAAEGSGGGGLPSIGPGGHQPLSLCFPLFSLRTPAFDNDEGIDVMLTAMSSFLAEHPDPKLRLVIAVPQSSPSFPLVATKLAASTATAGAVWSNGSGSGDGDGGGSGDGAASPRLFLFPGTVVDAMSCAGSSNGGGGGGGGGHSCATIATPCNWRLVGRGGGINAEVHRVAGADLHKLASQEHGTAEPTKAYVTQLPAENPLCTLHLVSAVIHVLPPAKSTPAAERAPKLKETYENMLGAFWERACATMAAEAAAAGEEEAAAAAVSAAPALASDTNAREGSGSGDGDGDGDGDSGGGDGALACEPKATAATATAAAAGSGGSGGSGAAAVAATDSRNEVLGIRAAALPTEYRPPEAPPATGGHWKEVLQHYVKSPEAFPDHVLAHSRDVVIIYDAFPKSRVHLLLLPRPSFIAARTPSELRDTDLVNLQQLHSLARWLSYQLERMLGMPLELRCGYHALPSLYPMHLHLITQDFDSHRLKHKKHWNSFTTEFFLPCERVEQLLAEGEQRLRAFLSDRHHWARCESAQLRCHRCGRVFTSMPSLKKHVALCSDSVRVDLFKR